MIRRVLPVNTGDYGRGRETGGQSESKQEKMCIEIFIALIIIMVIITGYSSDV